MPAHSVIGSAQCQRAMSFLCGGGHVGGCNGFDQRPRQTDPFRHARQPTHPCQPLQVVRAGERTIGDQEGHFPFLQVGDIRFDHVGKGGSAAVPSRTCIDGGSAERSPVITATQTCFRLGRLAREEVGVMRTTSGSSGFASSPRHRARGSGWTKRWWMPQRRRAREAACEKMSVRPASYSLSRARPRPSSLSISAVNPGRNRRSTDLFAKNTGVR